jgi:hypothetical protein
VELRVYNFLLREACLGVGAKKLAEELQGAQRSPVRGQEALGI